MNIKKFSDIMKELRMRGEDCANWSHPCTPPSALETKKDFYELASKLEAAVFENEEKGDGKMVDKIHVIAGVPYVEDAIVNGVEESDDSHSMPFLKFNPTKGEYDWDITIDFATGRIEGWPEGTTARTWYKVCDCCKIMVDGYKDYYDYVPNFLSIYARGFGDYIYVEIEGDGTIKDWDKSKVLQFISENMTKADNA